MRTFAPDRTCWSLLLTALAVRLRNKPTYDKLRVLIINKDVRKSLARKNGNENPIWSWNDSTTTRYITPKNCRQQPYHLSTSLSRNYCTCSLSQQLSTIYQQPKQPSILQQPNDASIRNCHPSYGKKTNKL